MVCFIVDFDYLDDERLAHIINLDEKMIFFTRDNGDTVSLPLNALNRNITVVTHVYTNVRTFVAGLIEGIEVSKSMFTPILSMLPSMITSRMSDERYVVVTNRFDKFIGMNCYDFPDSSSEESSSSD